MLRTRDWIARRTLVMAGGLGLGAGLASRLAQAAETSGAAAQQAAPGPDIWSGEYWAKKGDSSHNLWRKRSGAPPTSR